MGNLGVSAGTATSWLGLNVEPAARPSLVLPQDAWSWRETASEDGPLGTRVTSDCPFCLSGRTLLLFLYSQWSHTRGSTMVYLMASGWK